MDRKVKADGGRYLTSADIVTTFSPVIQFHTIKLPSNAHEATYVLLRLIHLTALTCPHNSLISSPVSIFQTNDELLECNWFVNVWTTVTHQMPNAQRPLFDQGDPVPNKDRHNHNLSFGEKSTQRNGLPINARLRSPVSKSQILTVRSAGAVTRILSFSLTSLMRELWPFSTLMYVTCPLYQFISLR